MKTLLIIAVLFPLTVLCQDTIRANKVRIAKYVYVYPNGKTIASHLHWEEVKLGYYIKKDTIYIINDKIYHLKQIVK